MKRKILDFMLTTCCMAFSFLGLVACDNELDIRQEYPFTVETMPVADEITDGRLWKSGWKSSRKGTLPEPSIR